MVLRMNVESISKSMFRRTFGQNPVVSRSSSGQSKLYDLSKSLFAMGSNRVPQGWFTTEVWGTKRFPLAGRGLRRREWFAENAESPPPLYRCQWKSFCFSHFRFGLCLEYPIAHVLIENSTKHIKTSLIIQQSNSQRKNIIKSSAQYLTHHSTQQNSTQCEASVYYTLERECSNEYEEFAHGPTYKSTQSSLTHVI